MTAHHEWSRVGDNEPVPHALAWNSHSNAPWSMNGHYLDHDDRRLMNPVCSPEGEDEDLQQINRLSAIGT